MNIVIPADVPRNAKRTFQTNMRNITKNTQRLAMFSADQKIEHLDPVSPDKLFSIANSGNMGAFATHLGLIHRYGIQYTDINYIVKIDGKSNLYNQTYDDPYSSALYNIDQIVTTQQNTNIHICGVGYTVYLGSRYEAYMLQEAAHLIYHAHQEGFIAIIWMYPRGKAVTHETQADIITGATSVATSIGADFVKVKPPQQNKQSSAQNLAQTTAAAGNTRVICSGGPKQDAYQFLHELYTQIHTGMTAGCAIGRNIFQRDIGSGVAMTRAIAAIVYENYTYDEAYTLL